MGFDQCLAAEPGNDAAATAAAVAAAATVAVASRSQELLASLSLFTWMKHRICHLSHTPFFRMR